MGGGAEENRGGPAPLPDLGPPGVGLTAFRPRSDRKGQGPSSQG
jgi:hypothetical protein